LQPDKNAILRARDRISAHINRTPVVTSSALDELCNAHLFFKCENFQKTGSFKARGAFNAILSRLERGPLDSVVTHSSGNHGQALACAAGRLGITARIVVPRMAPAVKVRAMESYGGILEFCEPSMEARVGTAMRIAGETGAVPISSCDDPDIIAGQASAMTELIDECEPLDLVLAPLGGGGLLSGTVLAARHFAPATVVTGVVPEMADDAYWSLTKGTRIESTYPPTVADGLRLSIGQLPFEILSAASVEVARVSESAIVSAMREIWERMKLVVEPSACVGYAAIRDGLVAVRGKRVGIILSGGNVDLNTLPWS